MLKCHIARSLLPSYIDDVLDEESRKDVEEHLEGCAECAAACEEMKRPAEAEEAEPPPPKEINYLRKLRRRKNIILAACAALATLVVAAGVCLKLFVLGWDVQKHDLDVFAYKEKGVWTFSLQHKGSRDIILREERTMNEESESPRPTRVYLRPRAVLRNPFNDKGSHTQLNYWPGADDFSVVIQYADGETVWNSHDLYDFDDIRRRFIVSNEDGLTLLPAD